MTSKEREKQVMYEMYPEWGPAAHDEEHPAHAAHWAQSQQAVQQPVQHSVQQAMDLRDNGGERPDDN